MSSPSTARREPSRCSFCDKARGEVFTLISGPGRLFICDECVELCTSLIAEQRAYVADRQAPTPQADPGTSVAGST